METGEVSTAKDEPTIIEEAPVTADEDIISNTATADTRVTMDPPSQGASIADEIVMMVSMTPQSAVDSSFFYTED